jgi:hypothetical protein
MLQLPVEVLAFVFEYIPRSEWKSLSRLCYNFCRVHIHYENMHQRACRIPGRELIKNLEWAIKYDAPEWPLIMEATKIGNVPVLEILYRRYGYGFARVPGEAVRYGKIEVLTWIVEKKNQIIAMIVYEIHNSIKYDHYEVFLWLIAHESIRGISDDYKRTCIRTAKKHERTTMLAHMTSLGWEEI